MRSPTRETFFDKDGNSYFIVKGPFYRDDGTSYYRMNEMITESTDLIIRSYLGFGGPVYAQ